MNITLDNSKISKHLGQTSQYKSTYDPSLLVAEPRSNNRKHLEIEDDKLPFVGYDTWNAYEVSALQNNGLPVTAVAKICYSCDSPSIVESKSIKLYFNSFNMTRLGNTTDEVINEISKRAEVDLSSLLETQVKVHLIDGSKAHLLNEHQVPLFRVDDRLEDHVDLTSANTFTVYQETPGLLLNNVINEGGDWEHQWCSSLLKSNCRVTSQPDWGDVFIHMKGSGIRPSELDLLSYIISFRDECHFHEEICETIYMRLSSLFNVSELVVTCLYARRGGIDINPTRASHKDILPVGLGDVTLLHSKTPKQ